MVGPGGSEPFGVAVLTVGVKHCRMGSVCELQSSSLVHAVLRLRCGIATMEASQASRWKQAMLVHAEGYGMI